MDARKSRFLSLLALAVVAGCGRLGTIPYCCPEQTPESWLAMQPYVEVALGPTRFIVTQPSSSVLIYLLGLLTVAVGWHFLRTRAGHASRAWWGVSLVLWGVGALAAGTSYQAFGYEIKCAGKEVCSWTSWWEIWYLLLTAASINAMMMGVARSSAQGLMRRILPVYAAVNTAVYFAVCLAGAFIPNKAMVSFELMVLFTGPSYVIFFIVNAVRYARRREAMDLSLMVTWLSLGLVMAAYFVYFGLGYTETLWSRGIWFSANDVLHIGLILWMLYIGLVVARRVKDQGEAAHE